jgi:AraC-like DNA-binding protein
MSVTEFLNKLRLQHSVKLLTENPEMSINEISDLSGFNSRVSFYRQFRQKYAISPTEYRRAALSKRPQDS